MLRSGLNLDGHKERSTAQAIGQASAPAIATILLRQHDGVATPRVKVGESVSAGQPIADAQRENGVMLHAPISGTIVAMEARRSPQRPEAPCLSIVIENDGKSRRFEHPAVPAFQSLDPLELCRVLNQGGIVGLGGAAFPTATKILSSRGSPDIHLLLNGAECEPWISCDDMLMRERASDVVLGASILRHATSAKRCTIAVETDMPEAHAALLAALKAHGEDMELIAVPSVYPAGGERQLIATATGREVPSGGLPTDIGALCQNVGTAAAVARWIRDGEPLISRIITVTGSAIRNAGNLEVSLGTPLAQLIADCGGYVTEAAHLIMGGSMMGIALPDDDFPTVKAANCIIAATALDLQPRAAEMPCIRCGNCSEACPAALLPQELHRHALAANLPALERFGLMDCIECGCCDNVCPSQIPLTHRFIAAKIPLASALNASGMATASRERFEARQRRLAALEEERRARLQAKRKQYTAQPGQPDP